MPLKPTARYPWRPPPISPSVHRSPVVGSEHHFAGGGWEVSFERLVIENTKRVFFHSQLTQHLQEAPERHPGTEAFCGEEPSPGSLRCMHWWAERAGRTACAIYICACAQARALQENVCMTQLSCAAICILRTWARRGLNKDLSH